MLSGQLSYQFFDHMTLSCYHTRSSHSSLSCPGIWIPEASVLSIGQRTDCFLLSIYTMTERNLVFHFLNSLRVMPTLTINKQQNIGCQQQNIGLAGCHNKFYLIKLQMQIRNKKNVRACILLLNKINKGEITHLITQRRFIRCKNPNYG